MQISDPIGDYFYSQPKTLTLFIKLYNSPISPANNNALVGGWGHVWSAAMCVCVGVGWYLYWTVSSWHHGKYIWCRKGGCVVSSLHDLYEVAREQFPRRGCMEGIGTPTVDWIGYNLFSDHRRCHIFARNAKPQEPPIARQRNMNVLLGMWHVYMYKIRHIGDIRRKIRHFKQNIWRIT